VCGGFQAAKVGFIKVESVTPSSLSLTLANRNVLHRVGRYAPLRSLMHRLASWKAARGLSTAWQDSNLRLRFRNTINVSDENTMFYGVFYIENGPMSEIWSEIRSCWPP